MTGMDHFTGADTAEYEDVRQSINDIVWTLIGTRIARRDYGSWAPAMIDAPANAANRTLFYSAVATALRRWEPRIAVKRVALVAADAFQGAFELIIDSVLTDSGAAQSFRLAIAKGANA